jgi:hypothetical protein
MKKSLSITNLLLIVGAVLLLSMLLLSGCGTKVPETPSTPLFNESLNQNLENLTTPAPVAAENFTEFFFNYTPTNRSKYEIAKDDIFTLSNGNFTSKEISFFGIMLGDSYESVRAKLGVPDALFIPADESYKNMDYRKRIGIGSIEAGITFHIENDTVTRITVKPSFKKYLHGNTTIGLPKASVYYLLDVPDYQDFTSSMRIFYYVEKGVEIYLTIDKIDRMSFVMPEKFKGVVYEKKVVQVTNGIYGNITEPVRIE